jgi:heme-degrading monooxygenase HmoA
MTIVTVFRSRLRPGVEERYLRVADEMSNIVRSMDGFIDQRFYTASDGERVTIVRFESHDTHRAWAEHPDHVRAQNQGRREFYSWYDISVSEETYQRTFDYPTT